MTTRSIEVVIEPDGSVRIEAMNFAGTKCEQGTRFLEVALGVVKKRQRKPGNLVKVQSPIKQQVRV